MTVRCSNCVYLRRRMSMYRSNDDLTCLMGECPSEQPKYCEFYCPKEVK